MSLEGTHFYPENSFALRGQRLQHVPLESPQHQRFELLMELPDFFFVIIVIEIELVR